MIQQIVIQSHNTGDGSQSWDVDLLTKLMAQVQCSGDDLAAIKSMIHLAKDVDELDIEMYPNDRLQTPGRLAMKNVYAKRPVASSSGGGKHEASSAAALGPRCKRAVKEYISEYLSLI